MSKQSKHLYSLNIHSSTVRLRNFGCNFKCYRNHIKSK